MMDKPMTKHDELIAALETVSTNTKLDREIIENAIRELRVENEALTDARYAEQVWAQRCAELEGRINDMRSGALCAAVKPLEWSRSGAQTPFGNYIVTCEDHDDRTVWFVLFRGKTVSTCGVHGDEISAKAAAQADYERRTNATLTLRPEAEVRDEGFALGFKEAREAAATAAARSIHARAKDENWHPSHVTGMCVDTMSAIRALTPPTDAQASLDALEARVRAEVVDKLGPLRSVLEDAVIAAEKAMRKFPQPNYVISKWAEETGEVTKALIHLAEGRYPVDEVRGEIVQSLAMMHRLMVEGDQVHGLPALKPLFDAIHTPASRAAAKGGE